jgi:hypothetical protein
LLSSPHLIGNSLALVKRLTLRIILICVINWNLCFTTNKYESDDDDDNYDCREICSFYVNSVHK